MMRRMFAILIACMMITGCCTAEVIGNGPDLFMAERSMDAQMIPDDFNPLDYIGTDLSEDYALQDISGLYKIGGLAARYASDRHPTIDVYYSQKTEESLEKVATMQAIEYGTEARRSGNDDSRVSYSFIAFEIYNGVKYMTRNTLFEDVHGNIVETVFYENVVDHDIGDSGLVISLPGSFRPVEATEPGATATFAEVSYVLPDGSNALPAMGKVPTGELPPAPPEGELTDAPVDGMPLPPEGSPDEIPAMPENAQMQFRSSVSLIRLDVPEGGNYRDEMAARCLENGLDPLHITLNGMEAAKLYKVNEDGSVLVECCFPDEDKVWIVRIEAEAERAEYIKAILNTIVKK